MSYNKHFIDNEKAIFGTSKDAEIYFDGTDLIINPDAVGSGVLKIGGDLNLDSNDITDVVNMNFSGIIKHTATTGTAFIFTMDNSDVVGLKYDADTNLLSWSAGPTTPFSVNFSSGDVTLSNNVGLTTIAGKTLALDKISFTQVDENEYIDSETDGDLDIAATNAIDFKISGTEIMNVNASGIEVVSSDVTGTDILFENTGASGPGTLLEMRRTKTAADDDALGQILWQGNDSVPSLTSYIVEAGVAERVTNGSEAGSLDWKLLIGGLSSSFLKLSGYNGSDGEGEIVLNGGLADIDVIMAGDTEANLFRLDAGTDTLRMGDWDTNYAQFSKEGVLTFVGTSRIDWTKIVANGATVTGCTTGDAVADLQTHNDGNTFTCSEVAGTTNHLVVDFTGVTAFNWIRILNFYDGGNTHGIDIQVEIAPFDGSAWHSLECMQHSPATTHCFENHSFFVPDDTAYINSGVVKVKFLHVGSTANGHLWVFDEVSLQQ